jgi:hypothetical protein
MRKHWGKVALAVVGLTVVFGAAFGFVVMGLWNSLVPALFGGKTIGFWQALGLLLLARILVGGFHGGPGRHGPWRGRMRDRWESMTPEERERFREGLRSHARDHQAPAAGSAAGTGGGTEG